MSIHFDYETTSSCDIKLGAYRYGSDPTTRILMFAIAKGDKDPLLWDFTDPYCDESLGAMDRLSSAGDSGELVYAHNAAFELAISTYRMEPDLGLTPPPLEVYRCTQAMCKRAAAPESLAQASEFFELGAKKDAAGKALIGIFSDQTKTVVLEPPHGMKDPSTRKRLKNGGLSPGTKPSNRKSSSPILDEEVLWDWRMKVGGELMSVREAWELFKDYCRQDVRAERELHKKLERFELKGSILESFQFDLRMNHKGVPVNIEALKHASHVSDTLKAQLSERFKKTTGLAPTQRGKTLEWLRERGYPEEDLQAATVQTVLENLPAEMSHMAKTVLKDYSLIQFAALAKIPAMLNSACSDGYVRGTTQWHAARTGRAGGRLIQPQNYRRPTIPDTDVCYQMIVDGWDATWFAEFWPSPLEALASSIRHFIQPHEGTFYSVDFKSVENFISAWSVGDKKELELMEAGTDMYRKMAMELFNVRYEDVTKEQRTIAKPIVLGCQYGAGGKTIQNALAKPPYNVERSREECDEYVRIYRDTHPLTTAAWKELDEASRSAVLSPGEAFPACSDRVEFLAGRVAGVNYLTMKLPSGRRLYYPEPNVKRTFKAYDEEEMELYPWKREEGGFWVDQVSYYGKLPVTGKWGRIGTWGARWLENLAQAVGVDLLNYGCWCAEQEGFDIRMIIHDEILAINNGRPIEELQEAFCRTQPWAEGLPLGSSGSIVPYYLKD